VESAGGGVLGSIVELVDQELGRAACAGVQRSQSGVEVRKSEAQLVRAFYDEDGK
jgi:hypothetical protein